MLTIFWLGSPFFAPSLSALGCNVIRHDFKGPETFGWNDIVRLAGCVPDMVVVADKSSPPFVRGIETFPCLTAFLCIDSHIHSWYPRYAQAFDICMVSLRDHLPWFRNMRLADDSVWWMPAFAKDQDLPRTMTAAWDLLFVGTVNAQTTPRRKIFLEKLREEIPGRLHVTTGSYRDLYPQGKVILNYCEHGDLNFRVFEALGCGCCLLTPAVENGQQELFRDGVHLRTYPPDDAHAAARAALDLLAADPLRRTLAENGLAAVDAGHRSRHRAQNFLEKIDKMDVQKTIDRRLQQAPAIHDRYLRLLYLLHAETSSGPYLRETYLKEACRYPRGT
jgi:hypothetical protein